MKAWDVLLDDRVEVRAPEAEGADAGATHAVGPRGELAQRRVHAEGARVPVHVGVGVDEVQARDEHLVVERADGLEEAGGSGRCLEVPDVGLHRAEPDRCGLGAGFDEDLVEGGQLSSVADACRRAVGLNVSRGCGIGLRCGPGALHGDLLPDWVGSGDALALAVRRAGNAADDAVDVLAVTLGVGQSAQHEECCALTHDEAVGSRVERAGPCRRQGPDLAELHERRDAHVAVDPARDDGVVGVRLQALHGCCHPGQTGRARCVGGEVRASEVEQRRHSAGDDVGELTGHRVLGDRQASFEKPVPSLGQQLLLSSSRHRAHRVGRRDGRQDLRQLDPQVGLVVLLPADGVADDDRYSFRVDCPVGPAGIHECHPRPGHRPLLTDVELVGDLGRNRKPPGHRVPVEVTHPPTDVGVRLVRHRRVRVVVQRRVPPLWRGLGDAVATIADVGPEGIGAGSVRHDGTDSDDGDGAERDVGHVRGPQTLS